MLTGHRGLNGRVQGQQVRLVGDIFNDTHNFTDFVRALAQAFDLFRGLLHVLANENHTLDRLTHRALAGFRILERIL